LLRGRCAGGPPRWQAVDIAAVTSPSPAFGGGLNKKGPAHDAGDSGRAESKGPSLCIASTLARALVFLVGGWSIGPVSLWADVRHTISAKPRNCCGLVRPKLASPTFCPTFRARQGLRMACCLGDRNVVAPVAFAPQDAKRAFRPRKVGTKGGQSCLSSC
jgi:hypothetical protein